MKRRRHGPGTVPALLLAAACALLGASPPVHAACPGLDAGNLRWVVPSRPGGGYDAYSRLLQPFVERALGLRILIENRPEAGGIVGAVAIRDAEPNGRTLGLINASGLLAANAVAARAAPDPAADYRILASVVSNHVVMFTGRDSGIGDLQAFLDLAATRPIVAGVRDAGSASFYALPVAAALLDFEYEMVTGYVGSAARTLAVMRGEVDAVFAHFDSVQGQVKAGELVPLLQLTTSAGGELQIPRLWGAEGAAAQRAGQTGRSSADAQEAAAALAAIVGAGRLVVAPRTLPEALAACLESSLAGVLQSAEFAAAAERANLGIEPRGGSAARQEVLDAERALPLFEPLIRAAVERARR